MVGSAFAFVMGVAAPFFLQALDVGEGAGVELEGEDFGVEFFGPVAEEALLELHQGEEGEEQREEGDGGSAEDAEGAHGLGGL